MKVVEVIFSPPECQYAAGIAIQRDATKVRKDGFGEQTSYGVNLIGVMGELSARKVYGGRINTEVLPNGDHHQGDLTLPDGTKVEVKASSWSSDDVELKFTASEWQKMERCCLVQVRLPDKAKVFPIMSKAELEPKIQKKNYGYGERYFYRPNGSN